MIHDSLIRERLVTGDKTAADVTRDIARPILNQPTKSWKIGFTVSLIFLGIFGISLFNTIWINWRPLRLAWQNRFLLLPVQHGCQISNCPQNG